jgi:hypothetical protein
MLTLYGALASLGAIWVLYVTGRHQLSAEYMSPRWLAEYRARHSD